MAIKKTPAPAPRDEGLQQISAWHDWFVGAHEQILRDSVNQHLIEQERAKIAALATAIRERMTSDYLSRRHP